MVLQGLDEEADVELGPVQVAAEVVLGLSAQLGPELLSLLRVAEQFV